MWLPVSIPATAALLGLALYYYSRRSKALPNNAAFCTVLLDRLSVIGEVMARKESAHVASLKLKNGRDTEQFVIRQVNARLLIVWTFASEVHGKRGKEWAFESTDSQEKISDAIMAELRDYRRILHRER